jgi:electron transport complex protein RnfG
LSALNPIGFSKTGANRDNNEIDAISGATITTTATTNAVNAAIDMFNTVLKGE